MAQLIVAGLDRGACEDAARRLRALAAHAHLTIDVAVTSDALDVQRLGTLGLCSLIVDGRMVAQGALPADAELEQLLVRWTAAARATGRDAHAA